MIYNKAEVKLKLETRGKLLTIMSLLKVFQKLKSSAQKRPLLFNSMIYGSFYTGAEFAQQTYNKIFKFSLSPVSANIEETNTFEIKKPLSLWIRNFNQKLGLLDENNSTQSRSYNWAQLKRYAIYGCFIAGPILHGWYKWLDIFYKGQTIKIVLTKLLVDQFILTPPLITLFFISMSLMEGKSNPLDECKAKFLQTFKTSCMYWLPVQFLNFLLVPSVLRVSFVSIAAFCWVNILCYLKSIPVSECNNN
ncbi:PXMP2/4 family protein 4 isoform X1 [Bombus impatiens]|uniref:PXMP2/4 family protein 4 isoform X1 n=2 Tax=Bombus impatiens TaxID=132113 RepID=A0A6P3UYZ4_BOMIM|nr:PXMP2/4 family protein 4 isoform X1 [Bombus impatiens]